VNTVEELVTEATGGLPSPLAAVLTAVSTFVRRFVSLSSDHQATAVALWVAHVYAIEAAHAAAYLRITSAVEESGKTTLLEVLELLLGDHAIKADSISPAAVFRHRDKIGPVALLLDEIDQTLRDRKDDGARDLLALVNAGYRRTARAIRTVGPNHEARAFAAFGPCVITGLGMLPATTESRCIRIELDRKLRGSGERWIPFLVEPDARAIREALEEWATPEIIDALRGARPFIPSELRDRHAEVWWAMLAIADAAGGAWPTRARQAAIVLHADRDTAATASLGVLLLDHIRTAFAEGDVDRLASADLLSRLVANEEGPWGKFWGAELNRDGPPHAAPADLARMLRGFKRKDASSGKMVSIRPHVIRVGEQTPRGYHVDDFAEAWARYLSTGPATPATPATPLARDVAPVAPVAGGEGSR
jgi:hypothetical protein